MIRRPTEKNTELLLERLSTGQRALRKIRWQISGSMAILGLAFAAASSAWPVRRYGPRPAGRGAIRITVRLAQGGEVDHLDLTISWTISVTGIVLLVSAPLPDDATLTRLASLGVATLCGFFTSYEAVDAVKHLKMFAEAQCWQRPNVITFEDRRMSQGICIWYLCLCVWNVSWNVLNMGLFLSTAFQRSAYTMQDRMWRFLTLFFQVNVFVDVVQILFDTVALHRLNTGCFFLIGDLTGLCLTCYGGVPKRLHELLRRYFEATERTAAAAGIASLVGNCAVQEALDQATSRFRVINVDKIQLSDLGSNQPSAELFERSVPASLGSCDAFISHSWSDDPGAKWAALISWRDRFVSSRDMDHFNHAVRRVMRRIDGLSSHQFLFTSSDSSSSSSSELSDSDSETELSPYMED
eukprot:g30857.t1